MIRIYVCQRCFETIGISPEGKELPPGIYDAQMTLMTDCGKCYKIERKGGVTSKDSSKE